MEKSKREKSMGTVVSSKTNVNQLFIYFLFFIFKRKVLFT